jgi:hypothetical protein
VVVSAKADLQALLELGVAIGEVSAEVKRLRAELAATRAVVDAAKAEVAWCLANPHDHASKYWPPMVDAVRALRALQSP